MPTPALRVVTRLTRWTWAAVALIALGVVAVTTVLWVTSTVATRIDAVNHDLSQFGQGNRQAFCNTERLLLIRAVQNGYVVPAHRPTDVCGLPILDNPSLPPEGEALPPGATVPPATSTSRPGGAGAGTSTPRPVPTATSSPPAPPRPSVTPTPNCILGLICP